MSTNETAVNSNGSPLEAPVTEGNPKPDNREPLLNDATYANGTVTMDKVKKLDEISSDNNETVSQEVELQKSSGADKVVLLFEEAKARVNETRDNLERFRPKQDAWMKEYMMDRPLYKVDGKPSKHLYSRFFFGVLGGATGGAISWLFDRNDNILGRMVIGGILVLICMLIASTYGGIHDSERQSIRRFLARIFLNDQVKSVDDRSLQTKQYLSAVKLYGDLVNKTRTQLESEGVFEAINLGVNNEALPGESFTVSLDEDGRFVYCPTGLNDEEYSLNNDNVKLREEMLVHLRTLSPRTLS